MARPPGIDVEAVDDDLVDVLIDALRVELETLHGLFALAVKPFEAGRERIRARATPREASPHADLWERDDGDVFGNRMLQRIAREVVVRIHHDGVNPVLPLEIFVEHLPILFHEEPGRDVVP